MSGVNITAASYERFVDPTGITQKVRDFGFICARLLCFFRVEHVGPTTPFRYDYHRITVVEPVLVFVAK